MKLLKSISLTAVITVFLTVAITSTNIAMAHCDGMDGPVVTLAKEALEMGNVNLVLPWVPKDGEQEIRRAFDHTMAVRKLGSEAKHLADRFFFETLVRVHRASEGAPYTGLKPAGLDLGPAIPAADKALDTGSLEAVEKLLTNAIHKRLHEHFHDAVNHKKFDKNNVEAGRRYVEAYVPYVHYVEGLWEAASNKAKGHYPETQGHTH